MKILCAIFGMVLVVLVVAIGFRLNDKEIDRKVFKFGITEIDPPKRFRAYGVPEDKEAFHKWLNENNPNYESSDLESDRIQLYSSKHCIVSVEVGQLIDIEAVKYESGRTYLIEDRNVFCGGILK